MAYDPNATYIFTNGETGETFTLDGTDPLAKEAMMNGLPISVTENGERFIYPFVTQEGNSVVVHLPNWFKESDEYLEWEYVWAPTIPNTEINPYTVSIMNKTLDRLGREAAAKRTSNETNLTVAPEKTTTTTQETQQLQQDFWSQNVFQNYNVTVVAIGIAIIITVAFGFTKNVKNKIRRRQEFSGIGWALLNAVVGLGIVGLIAVIIAYNSINREIEATRSRRYKKYAKRQMGDFVKTYAICFGVKLLVVIIINALRYTN